MQTIVVNIVLATVQWQSMVSLMAENSVVLQEAGLLDINGWTTGHQWMDYWTSMDGLLDINGWTTGHQWMY